MQRGVDANISCPNMVKKQWMFCLVRSQNEVCGFSRHVTSRFRLHLLPATKIFQALQGMPQNSSKVRSPLTCVITSKGTSLATWVSSHVEGFNSNRSWCKTFVLLPWSFRPIILTACSGLSSNQAPSLSPEWFWPVFVFAGSKWFCSTPFWSAASVSCVFECFLENFVCSHVFLMIFACFNVFFC